MCAIESPAFHTPIFFCILLFDGGNGWERLNVHVEAWA